MKTRTILFASLLATMLAAPALAAVSAEGKAPTAQQQRMKSCNAEAKSKSLKGDDRRAFMSSCLKGHASASTSEAPATQSARRQ